MTDRGIKLREDIQEQYVFLLFTKKRKERQKTFF